MGGRRHLGLCHTGTVHGLPADEGAGEGADSYRSEALGHKAALLWTSPQVGAVGE